MDTAADTHDARTQRPRAAGHPDTFSLAGRHIVVTGGGRGIGRAIAVAAAGAGATITVVARSRDQLAETATVIHQSTSATAHVVPTDLATADFDVLAEVLLEPQRVDGIVHAAGVQVRKPALEVTREDWRRVQAVNLEAPFFLSTALTRHTGPDGAPDSHVFIGSLNSSIALPNIAPYVVSKSGIVGVARILSREWAAHGIRANVLAPGYVRTAMTDELLRQPHDAERILGRIPASQLGTPDDIANAAVFLLSDASTYITGQVLNVDGGWLAA